ncbi:MAG: gamma-glutamylcyclotransferase [bacterium]|nr:gamma-glutamylcyclotransferase [bacterium]MDE0289290.1 gamma-glutamylcyclotransferase [bacterium]MDE0439679.1 gamma-glutamylcyclotransferase [bacterium]
MKSKETKIQDTRRAAAILGASERLPLAVYGTLRPGFGNHRLLAGRSRREEPGLVEGYELLVDRIPFARRRAGRCVVVEVVWPIPAVYDKVLADVDYLEGYDPSGDPAENLYRRVAVTATTGQDEHVRAWLYEVGPLGESFLPSRVVHVPSGDYADVEYR